MWSNFFQTLYMSGKDCSGLFWTLDVVTTDDPVTNFETFQTDRAGCHYLETEHPPFLQFSEKKMLELAHVFQHEMCGTKVRWSPATFFRAYTKELFTVTVVNNGESVIWRRRHYLFTVTETGRGIIYGGVFFSFFFRLFPKRQDEGLAWNRYGRTEGTDPGACIGA